MPPTATRKGVELVKVGTWAASTGITKITPEDLADMVRASHDPDVDEAYVKIGHVDPRFDGEPALGWIRNLRVEGDRLVGDLEDVPSALAEIMPKAYKRRSVEIAWGVRTPRGKRYRAALTGLALLGVQAPAVKGLADVLSMYGDRKATTSIGYDGSSYDRRRDNLDDLRIPNGSDHSVAASSSALSVGDDLDPKIEQARLEAERATAAYLEAIGADDEAKAATLAALSEVKAGNPQDSPNGPDDIENTDPSGGNAGMLDEARIRELLKLEADADVEAALKALTAEKETTETKETKEVTETTETPAEPAIPATQTPEGGGTDNAPASQPENSTEKVLATLSAQVAEVQNQLKASTEVSRRKDIDEALTSALSAGKIVPADIESNPEKGKVGWREQLEKNFEGTVSLLSGLTPTVPTSELGALNALETEVDAAAWDAFEKSVFGESFSGGN